MSALSVWVMDGCKERGYLPASVGPPSYILQPKQHSRAAANKEGITRKCFWKTKGVALPKTVPADLSNSDAKMIHSLSSNYQPLSDIQVHYSVFV